MIFRNGYAMFPYRQNDGPDFPICKKKVENDMELSGWIVHLCHIKGYRSHFFINETGNLCFDLRWILREGESWDSLFLWKADCHRFFMGKKCFHQNQKAGQVSVMTKNSAAWTWILPGGWRNFVPWNEAFSMLRFTWKRQEEQQTFSIIEI